MKLAFLSALVILVCSTSAAVECETPGKCNEIGTIALKRGEIDKAIRYFETQVHLASWLEIENGREMNNAKGTSEFEGIKIRGAKILKYKIIGYNNLALSYYKKEEYFYALAWARLALENDPSNKAAIHNINIIDNKLKLIPIPEKLTGTYQRYAFGAAWNTLKVEQLSKKKIMFQLFAYRAGGGNWYESGPAGIGGAGGMIPLQGNVAVYEFRREGEGANLCRLTFKFIGTNVEVEQEGSDIDCQFGRNVNASGIYVRTHIGTPYFGDERDK